MEADIIEFVVGGLAVAYGIGGLIELYLRAKKGAKQPFDWAQECPELRQASHVRLSKKGTCNNDHHGDPPGTQETIEPLFVF